MLQLFLLIFCELNVYCQYYLFILFQICRERKLKAAKREVATHQVAVGAIPEELPKVSNAVLQAKFGIRHLIDKVHPPTADSSSMLKVEKCLAKKFAQH